MRWFLLVSWRAVLGLRFGPPHSADHILGWHIVDRTAISVTIELCSWYLTCYLLLWTGDSHVVFSSSIRYHRRNGALVRPPRRSSTVASFRICSSGRRPGPSRNDRF